MILHVVVVQILYAVSSTPGMNDPGYYYGNGLFVCGCGMACLFKVYGFEGFYVSFFFASGIL